MNAKTFKGLVASLIATLAIFVSTSVVAKDGIGAVSFDASAKKVTAVQSTVTVYQTPDGRYSLSASGNEVAFTAYAPGTPGTFPARVNENGTVTLPAGKRLLTNPNIAVYRVFYNELTGTVAPTGMRKLLEVIAPTGDEFGSHRLVGVTTSYAKAEELVASTPNAFVSQWGWAVPTESKGLWVANANPTQTDPVTGLRLQGSYFDLTQPGFPRTDYGMGSPGFPSVDNSRQAAYFTQGMVRVNVLKSATNNPLDLQDNTPLLTSLVDEQTGKLVIVEGGTVGGGVWIQDPRNPTLTAPPAANYLRPRDARGANGLFNEEIVRAQLWGDLLALWRGSDQTSNGYTKGQLIVYNIRDWIDRGVRTSTTVQLPDAPATAGPVRLGPPAFDPSSRRFWVNYGLQRAYGSVTFSEDFSTAMVGEMKYLPREGGADSVSPDALYFDSSLGRLYIASHRYSNTAGYLAAELVAYSPDGNTRLASVRLPIASPSDVAIAPMQGVNKVVVASYAGGGVFPTALVMVDPVSMQVEHQVATLKGQHVAPALQ